MPHGGYDEAAGVYRACWWCGGVVARSALAAAAGAAEPERERLTKPHSGGHVAPLTAAVRTKDEAGVDRRFASAACRATARGFTFSTVGRVEAPCVGSVGLATLTLWLCHFSQTASHACR